jgi:alpha-tubulin suppressor-like RCC1 family protein
MPLIARTMKLSVRLILSSIILPAVLPCALSYAGLSVAELNNYKLLVEYKDTLLNAKHKTELERGIKLGMNMWASVLPDLHVIYVDSSSALEAVQFFKIDNYRTDHGIVPPEKQYTPPSGCPGNIQWGGCSPRGRTIYFNSRYEPLPTTSHKDAPLRVPWVDFFDNYSRRDWWSKWQPATYPPIFYKADTPENIGFYRGWNQSMSDLPHNRGDFVTNVVHEFGHSLRLGHPSYKPEDMLAWYGIPYKAGTRQPDKPHIIVVDTAVYRLFKSKDVCGDGKEPNPPCYYYGGAECPFVVNNTCPLPSPQHPAETWISDFRWSKLADKFSIMSYAVNAANHPPGVPHPFFPANNRIIHPRDIKRVAELNRAYAISYPAISGVIRLQEGGRIYLTSNWLDARSKAELDADKMSEHPFFVTGVWAKARVKATMAAGAFHSAAIKRNGTLWSWGANGNGELGNGTKAPSSSIPVQENTRDTSWIAVSAGNHHTLALRSDGTLWSWGKNSRGQLGTGDKKDSNVPVKVGKDSNWFAVSGGGQHSLALKNDGTLWAWGDGENYQLGNGSSKANLVPVQIGKENDWIVVAAGGNHSLALKADGSVWAWGSNAYKQCGVSSSNKIVQQATRVEHHSPFVMIDAGTSHSIALKDNGTVWCWGRGKNGQLGNGNALNSHKPEKVKVASDVIAVAAGSRHNLAIKCNGTLLAWGYNGHGELGLGTTRNKYEAFEVPMAEKWTQAAAGEFHSMAISNYKAGFSWGYNKQNQLGTDDPLVKRRLEPDKNLWK